MPVRMRWRMSKSLIKQRSWSIVPHPMPQQQPPALQLATGGVRERRAACPDPGEIGADTTPLARQAIAIHWLEYPTMSGFTLMSEWLPAEQRALTFWHASEDGEVKVIGDEPANTDYDPGPSVEAHTARRRYVTCRGVLAGHQHEATISALARETSISDEKRSEVHDVTRVTSSFGPLGRPRLQVTEPLLLAVHGMDWRPVAHSLDTCGRPRP